MNKTLIIGFSIITLQMAAQSVAISTDGSAAHPSALLEVKSNNQGFLTPRMTEEQRNAINAPATGLLVYQTDSITGFYFYDGNVWTSLSGGSTEDQLGNHAATRTLNMNNNAIANVTNLTATGTTTLGANTYPTTLGANGQLLTTNGAGKLSWENTAPKVVLDVSSTIAKTIPSGSTTAEPFTPYFNNVITTPPATIGTYTPNTDQGAGTSISVYAPQNINGSASIVAGTFVAAAAGYYAIDASIVVKATSSNSNNVSVSPYINIANSSGAYKASYYGTSVSNARWFYFDTTGRGIVNAVVKLEVGDKVSILGHNPNTVSVGNIATIGATRWTITKL